MTLLEELAQKAIVDEYFIELFRKAEYMQALDLFQLDANSLTQKEFIDLLRFADILSGSNNSDAKNLAYKTVSLLVDQYVNDSVFQTFAHSILVKLGNFPAIKFLEEHYVGEMASPFETVLEQVTKEIFQQIPDSEYIFTDSQYEIFEALKNNNHFSFAGPTSLGKSFIINAYISYLINAHRGTDNIVILVPSRALINQTVFKLKQNFNKCQNYKILSHPTVPTLYRNEETRYIFVFTPERLIAYLANNDNPKLDYLFVDEAHKIVADNDARSPLYYHAILQAERKSIKLFFSSPNVQNPEIFLQLFEKSTDEKIHIDTSPVAQNRYFLDLIAKKCMLFSDTALVENLSLDFMNTELNYWLQKLGEGQKNIVYCNSKADTIQYALEFARTQPGKMNEQIQDAIEVIKEYLHGRYYLIDCLKKGVAFHFGNLPQFIREKVEQLFENKAIDFLFSTSTLLEGVNLPAKNIFILSNEIGLSKFSDLDFWNLAGRAGRMTKEMSGNIICLRAKENKWNNPDKDLKIIQNRSIKKVRPLLVSGAKHFYQNVEASLTDQSFSRKNASNSEKAVWNHYANLALIHELRTDDSVLRTNLLTNVDTAKEVLSARKNTIEVPVKILNASSMIKAKYQNTIFTDPQIENLALPSEFDYETILKFLHVLSTYYNWEEEETGGRNPLYKPREKIKYYAFLMDSWMKSTPLKMMISNTIDFYNKKGQIWVVNQYENFDATNQRQINIVINEIIADIDNVLRFKLKNYFENYYNLLRERLGISKSGANWADYLEYGTTNNKIIELQNVGIPRHLAQYIIKHHLECLTFEDDVLIAIDIQKIKNDFDEKTHEYRELLEIFSNS